MELEQLLAVVNAVAGVRFVDRAQPDVLLLWLRQPGADSINQFRQQFTD
jgi:hypothetical protein